jgi:ketosteroid isomerase-like protein
MRVFAGLILAATLAAGLGACDQLQGSSLSLRGIEALEARVQVLEDERDALALIDGLDLAVDAKQWEAVRAMFADTIQADFSSLGGAPGPLAADDLVNGWRRNLFEGKPSFRLRGGARVSVDGDSASVIANGYAWNALPQLAENNFWEVWGRYEYGLSRSEDGWKIVSMTFVAMHQRGDASVRSETQR